MTLKGGKMIKSSLFVHYRFVLVFVLFFLSMLLGGCQYFPPVGTPTGCAQASADANIYKAPPQGLSNGIFEFAHPPTPIPQPSYTPDPVNTPIPAPTVMPTNTPYPGQVETARYAAFRHLIWETERWSHVQNIKFKDSSETEIVITFISPELLQAVFLVNALKEGSSISDFQAQARAALDSIAEREELLFLLTVTSPLNNTGLNNHVIKFDTKTLMLKNAEGLELEPGHIESNLGQPINSSSEAVFGYFGYPLIKPADEKCQLALDPKYNTNIVITLPSIEVDGILIGPFSWTIAYAPLMDLEVPPAPPDFNMPPGYDQSQIAPAQIPPSAIKQANRWQDFAKFVWYKITLGN
jgi:hypothetical protein